MANKAFQINSYLSYWLDAVDQHSLHSPFFFDFYTKVIKSTSGPFEKIEDLRKKLRSDNRTITVNDPGTKGMIRNVRKISEIASSSLTPEIYSLIYNRVIQKFDHKIIVELGTSLGINTLYLAAKKNCRVTTFEGSDEVADIAELTFEFGQAKNIALQRGNIDSTLPDFLLTIRKVDFAFIDANHTYEATTRYFRHLLSKINEKSVFALDDIHSSSGMEKAWKEIRGHDLVYGSADLYRCGFVFFDPSLNKQHVILQF